MTIETLNLQIQEIGTVFRDKIEVLSVSSINTLLAILKGTDARRDVILAGGLYHRFPWRHLPPPPPECTVALLIKRFLTTSAPLLDF